MDMDKKQAEIALATAQVDQVRAALDEVLDNLVKIVIDGLETGLDESLILATLSVDMEDNPDVTRKKLIGLLGAAVLQMGRAQHQGDWA